MNLKLAALAARGMLVNKWTPRYLNLPMVHVFRGVTTCFRVRTSGLFKGLKRLFSRAKRSKDFHTCLILDEGLRVVLHMHCRGSTHKVSSIMHCCFLHVCVTLRHKKFVHVSIYRIITIRENKLNGIALSSMRFRKR